MVLNQGWTYRDRVSGKSAGCTLLAFYSQRYRHSSAADWQARILAGQVQIDGHAARPDACLTAGQQLTYHRPPWDEPEVPLGFEVLHADADIVAVNKPAGLPVLPGGGFLMHTLLHQLRLRFPEAVPVHRLGRGTSGLLLAARSPLAKQHLSHQWRCSSGHSPSALHKEYRALIGPSTLPDHCVVDVPIGKLPHPDLGYIYGADPAGKHAHSQVRVLRRSADATLLSVVIRTGRPHQIRIHLAALGYPLLGDPLYQPGGTPALPTQRCPVPSDGGYHLHAHRLGFIHPKTEAPLEITAPLPERLT